MEILFVAGVVAMDCRRIILVVNPLPPIISETVSVPPVTVPGMLIP